jgi:Tfp pilus assembly protein PilP
MKTKLNIIIFLSLLSSNLIANTSLDNNKQKRNIFDSLISVKKTNKNKSKVNLQNTPILQRYDLSKYELNAVIVSKKETKILIIEKYSNSLFKLKIGDRIGKNGDLVIDINKNEVLIGKSKSDITKKIEIKIKRKGDIK